MTIDTIDVAIAANVSGLQAGLLLAKNMIQSFASQVSQTMDSISHELNNAKMLNMNVDAFRGLEVAAKRAGVEVSVLKTSIKQMERGVGEAINKPGGKMAEIFSSLGLDPKKIALKENMQQLLEIATRLDQIGNTSQRAALEQKLFGRGFNPNLLHQLAIGFQEAEENVKKLRGEMSNIDAQKVLDAKNALANLENVWTGFKEQLSKAIAPLITQGSTELINLGLNAQTMGQAVVQAMDYIKTAIASLVPWIHGLASGFTLLALGGNKILTFASNLKTISNLSALRAEKAQYDLAAEKQMELKNAGDKNYDPNVFAYARDMASKKQNELIDLAQGRGPQETELRRLEQEYKDLVKFGKEQAAKFADPDGKKKVYEWMTIAAANATVNAKKNLDNFVRPNSGIDDALIQDEKEKRAKQVGWALNLQGPGHDIASWMSGQANLSETKVSDKGVAALLQKVIFEIQNSNKPGMNTVLA